MAKLIAYPGFAEGVVAELKVLTGDPWEVMDHKFESIAAHGPLLERADLRVQELAIHILEEALVALLRKNGADEIVERVTEDLGPANEGGRRSARDGGARARARERGGLTWLPLWPAPSPFRNNLRAERTKGSFVYTF